MSLALSIVIPVYNEEDNIIPLYNKLKHDLTPLQLDYEIIFVDDGSTDTTFDRIKTLHQTDSSVKGIKFRRNFGKSVALNAAFKKACGDAIITMDGDLQDDSGEISHFLEKLEEGYDLVSGWKYPRKDPLTKTLPSKIFNHLTCLLTGVNLHDFNCGFKAYRKEVAEMICLYGEMHRYTPALAAWHGFRIGEIKVRHHPRAAGTSKYGISRLIKGMLDLITVKYLTTYASRPLHVFGVPGILSLSLGFVIGLYLVILKYLKNIELGDRPLLLLSILLIVLGLQFISIGLLGEMSAFRQVRDESVDKYIERTLGTAVGPNRAQ